MSARSTRKARSATQAATASPRSQTLIPRRPPSRPPASMAGAARASGSRRGTAPAGPEPRPAEVRPRQDRPASAQSGPGSPRPRHSRRRALPPAAPPAPASGAEPGLHLPAPWQAAYKPDARQQPLPICELVARCRCARNRNSQRQRCHTSNQIRVIVLGGANQPQAGACLHGGHSLRLVGPAQDNYTDLKRWATAQRF